MSYLSFNFGLFLALSLLIFHLVPTGWKPLVLLGFSLSFYWIWSPWDTLILLAATAAVFYVACLIHRLETEKQKFNATAIGVTGLLAMLVVFKCAPIWGRLFVRATGSGTAALLIVAPLGLSYYLFKLLSYLLDVYWEKMPPQRNFLSLALYVSFFPQIVSGPIQRSNDFFGQLGNLISPTPSEFTAGLRRILFGFFKKVVVADSLALLVQQAHAAPLEYSSLELLVGAYFFAFQLYMDFSGLTDIALGVGQLFGIKGPENFDLPYLARNVQEFWRKWHMSLTSWLSDYWFLPLRMSFRKLGNLGLALAIFINMVAVGVWHGPTWTYVAFGATNGLFMVVSALTLKKRNTFFQRNSLLAKVRAIAGPLLTFHLITFSFIFFRANSLATAISYIERLFLLAPNGGVPPLRFDWKAPLGVTIQTLFLGIIGLALMSAGEWAIRQPGWAGRLPSAPRFLRWSLYHGMITAVVFKLYGTKSFIYVQF